MEADDPPALRSLAAGMRHDLPTIINGLALEHSSSAVEAKVTCVKQLNRGYSRAKFGLLSAQSSLVA